MISSRRFFLKYLAVIVVSNRVFSEKALALSRNDTVTPEQFGATGGGGDDTRHPGRNRFRMPKPVSVEEVHSISDKTPRCSWNHWKEFDLSQIKE